MSLRAQWHASPVRYNLHKKDLCGFVRVCPNSACFKEGEGPGNSSLYLGDPNGFE